MKQVDFSKMDDSELTKAAFDERLGYSRAWAIIELSSRALVNANLLASACEAITSDKRIGFHRGSPLGWIGADKIYLSGNEGAMRVLLQHMDNWELSEQEDLVRHWAGKGGLATLARELQAIYGWVPRFQLTE